MLYANQTENDILLQVRIYDTCVYCMCICTHSTYMCHGIQQVRPRPLTNH